MAIASEIVGDWHFPKILKKEGKSYEGNADRSHCEVFQESADPRIDHTKDYEPLDIITIAICAVICGAETWVDVDLFGNRKLQ